MAREPVTLLYRLALGSALSLASLTAAQEVPQATAIRIATFAEGGEALAEDGYADYPVTDAIDASTPEPGQLSSVPEPKTEVITERHPNRGIRIERSVAQDAEGNYYNHGTWSNWDEQGVLRGSGTYRNGLRHGKWVRWFNAGEGKLFGSALYKQFQPPFVAEATFVDDKLDGTWVILDSKGRKASEWEFAQGQLHGISAWYFPNGYKQREVPYKQGQIEGEVREWTFDSRTAQRRSGQPQAEPVYALVSKINYQDGRRQVPHVEHYSPGHKKVEGFYMTPREIIKADFDFWNGSIQTAVVSKENAKQRCGLWTWYYKDGGKHLEGEFSADKPVGLHTWWYANGQKQSEGRYEAGEETGKWLWWYANGQKQVEGEFIAGVQAGHWTRWNELGKVVEVQDFSAGDVTIEPAEEAPLTADLDPPTVIPQPVPRPTLRQPVPSRIEASRRSRSGSALRR